LSQNRFNFQILFLCGLRRRDEGLSRSLLPDYYETSFSLPELVHHEKNSLIFKDSEQLAEQLLVLNVSRVRVIVRVRVALGLDLGLELGLEWGCGLGLGLG
jgi:hypothetical protein